MLFSVAFTSFALWRCQFDGLARSACCCPKATADDPRPGPTLVEGECCDVEHYAVGKAPAEAARPGAAQLAAMFSHVAVAAAASLPLVPAVPPSASPPVPASLEDDGWPGGGSVLARKQSLLI
jgi:hypothetical protein